MTVESSMNRWLIFSLRRRSAMMWSCTGPGDEAAADGPALPPLLPADDAARCCTCTLVTAAVESGSATPAPRSSAGSADAALKFQLTGLLLLPPPRPVVLERAVWGDHAAATASWSMAAPAPAPGLSPELLLLVRPP